MSTTPVEPEPTQTPEQPQEPAAAAPEQPEEPKQQPDKPTNPWDDPAAAKAEIERLRRENGASRTNAKAQAADEARKELAQQIGKALGLVEEETPDPAKLTEMLSASQTEAQQARVELAIFRAAGAVGGDPAALLDSTSFLKSLADIDPADTAAVQEAIKAAVEQNPRLSAAPEPRTPAPNPAQGSSGSGPATPQQLTKQDVERLYRERKYDEIEKARNEGRLATLLGG